MIMDPILQLDHPLPGAPCSLLIFFCIEHHNLLVLLLLLLKSCQWFIRLSKISDFIEAFRLEITVKVNATCWIDMLANAVKIAGCSCDQDHALFIQKSVLHLALVTGTSAKRNPSPIGRTPEKRWCLKTLKCNKSYDVTTHQATLCPFFHSRFNI